MVRASRSVKPIDEVKQLQAAFLNTKEHIPEELKEAVKTGITQKSIDTIKKQESHLVEVLQKNKDNTPTDSAFHVFTNWVFANKFNLPKGKAHQLTEHLIKKEKTPEAASLLPLLPSQSNESADNSASKRRKELNEFIKQCNFDSLDMNQKPLPSRELQTRCIFIKLFQNNDERVLRHKSKHSAWEIFSIPIRNDKQGGLWCFYVFDLVQYIAQHPKDAIPFPGLKTIEDFYPTHYQHLTAYLDPAYIKHINAWADSANMLNRQVEDGSMTISQIKDLKAIGDCLDLTSTIRNAAGHVDTHGIHEVVATTAGSWGSSVKNALVNYTGVRNMFDWLLHHRIIISMIRAFICSLNIIFFMGTNLRGLQNMELIQFIINFIFGDMLNRLYNAVYGVIKGQAESMSALFRQLFRGYSFWFFDVIIQFFPLFSFVSGISSVITQGAIDLYHSNATGVVLSIFAWMSNSYEAATWSSLKGFVCTIFTCIGSFFSSWGSNFSFGDINLGTISYDWQTVVAEWLCNAISICYTWLTRFVFNKDKTYNELIERAYQNSLINLQHECDRLQNLYKDGGHALQAYYANDTDAKVVLPLVSDLIQRKRITEEGETPTVKGYFHGKDVHSVDEGTMNMTIASGIGSAVGLGIAGPPGVAIGGAIAATGASLHNYKQRGYNIEKDKASSNLRLVNDGWKFGIKSYRDYRDYVENTIEGKAERKAQIDLCRKVKDTLDRLGKYFGMVKIVADIYFNSVFLLLHFSNRDSITKLFDLAQVFDGTQYTSSKESWFKNTMESSSCVTQYYKHLQKSTSKGISIQSIHDPHERKVVIDLTENIRGQISEEMKGKPVSDLNNVLLKVMNNTFNQDHDCTEWQDNYKANKWLDILSKSNGGKALLATGHLVGMKLPEAYVPPDIGMMDPIESMASFIPTMLSNLLQAGDHSYWQKIKEIWLKQRKNGMTRYTGIETSLDSAVCEYIQTHLKEDNWVYEETVFVHPNQGVIAKTIDVLCYLYLPRSWLQ